MQSLAATTLIRPADRRASNLTLRLPDFRFHPKAHANSDRFFGRYGRPILLAYFKSYLSSQTNYLISNAILQRVLLAYLLYLPMVLAWSGYITARSVYPCQYKYHIAYGKRVCLHKYVRHTNRYGIKSLKYERWAPRFKLDLIYTLIFNLILIVLIEMIWYTLSKHLMLLFSPSFQQKKKSSEKPEIRQHDNALIIT